MFRLLNKKGQNTAEYAILIGVIVAAAIAMQVYVRRGMQARVKDAVDYSKAGQPGIFNTSQYEPYYSDTSFLTTQDASQTESLAIGGSQQRNIANEYVSRTGVSVTGNWSGN